MSDRSLATLATVITVLLLMVVPVPAAAQVQTTDPSSPLRTPWGHPDLQGLWDYRTITPLERPEELAGKAILTAEEAADLEQQAVDRIDQLARPSAVRTEPLPVGGNVGAYNDFWFDRGVNVVSTRLTSLIVDPSHGRIPPLTPEGQRRVDVRAEARGRPAASWEDRSLFERCVTRGLPRLPGGYNQNLQILQTPDHVVILYEMMREARVIPLDGRPHLAYDIRLWHGDSRGRWEGATLVVETTNVSPKAHFRGSAEGLHLVERFTRIDADTLDHQVTIDDPLTFSQAWTASIPLKQSQSQMYEYACHEGNYGMEGILSGARAEEANATAPQGSR